MNQGSNRLRGWLYEHYKKLIYPKSNHMKKKMLSQDFYYNSNTCI